MLVVLACLLAVISVLVVYVRNEALDTDTYVEHGGPAGQQPGDPDRGGHAGERPIGRARPTSTSRCKQALPPEGRLPGHADHRRSPERHLLRSPSKLVQSPTFQKLWVAANRALHKQVVAAAHRQRTGAFKTRTGPVTLDLSKVEAHGQEGSSTPRGSPSSTRSRLKGPNFVLFQSNQLVRLQGTVQFLNRLVVLLPILTLLLFAGAIVAGPKNRRRGVCTGRRLGLALSMALILVIVAVARNQYLSGLDPSRSKPANAAVIDTVTAGLLDTVRTMLILSALVAVVGLPRRERLGAAVVRQPVVAGVDDEWTGPRLRVGSPKAAAVEHARHRAC